MTYEEAIATFKQWLFQYNQIIILKKEIKYILKN